MDECQCMSRWTSPAAVLSGHADCTAVLGCPAEACDGGARPWCVATGSCKDDQAGFLDPFSWFYCAPPEPTKDWRKPEPAESGCRTKSSPSEKCVFPFLYKEKIYHSCTRDGGSELWCATVPSEKGVEEHGHRGLCHDDCDGLCNSPVAQSASCGSLVATSSGWGLGLSVGECKALRDKKGGDTINFDPSTGTCYVRSCGRDADLLYVPDAPTLVYAEQCKEGGMGLPAVAPLATGELGPLIWCTSGGGTTAESSAMAFAHAFNKAGLFNRSDLAAVSSNSGGSWFNLMFHYSPDTFAAVTGDMDDLLRYAAAHFRHEIMVMTNASSASHDPSASDQFFLTLLKSFSSFFAKEFFSTHGWRGLMDEVFSGSPGRGVGAKPAHRAGRVGYTAHAVHIQANVLTMALLADKESPCELECPAVANAVLYDSEGRSLARGPKGEVVPLIPVQYVVPGDGSPGTAGLRVAESSYFNYHLEGATQDFQGVLERRSVELPEEPQVIDVLSWSSAAPAFLNSPFMVNDIVAHFFEAFPSLSGALHGLIDSPSLLRKFTAMSICGQPTTQDGHCQFPSVKFADGGVSDNLGFAQTLAIMQKEHPGKTLRFVVTDNQNAAPIVLPSLFDGFPETKLNRRFDANYLFQPPVKTDVWELSRALGAALPVPWILEQPEGQPIRWEVGFQNSRFTVKYAEVSTKSVYNAQFGVLAGTPVELLLFVVDGLDILPLTTGMADYLELIEAVAAKAGVDGILNKWLQGRGAR